MRSQKMSQNFKKIGSGDLEFLLFFIIKLSAWFKNHVNPEIVVRFSKRYTKSENEML